MRRKLFAFDIDGTLLDSNKQALDSTREALEKLRKEPVIWSRLLQGGAGSMRKKSFEIWILRTTFYVMERPVF